MLPGVGQLTFRGSDISAVAVPEYVCCCECLIINDRIMKQKKPTPGCFSSMSPDQLRLRLPTFFDGSLTCR